MTNDLDRKTRAIESATGSELRRVREVGARRFHRVAAPAPATYVHDVRGGAGCFVGAVGLVRQHLLNGFGCVGSVQLTGAANGQYLGRITRCTHGNDGAQRLGDPITIQLGRIGGAGSTPGGTRCGTRPGDGL